MLLKSPNTPFLGRFWPFLVIFTRRRFFWKNWAVMYISKCGPNTIQSFRKTTKPIPRKLLERTTDGRIDQWMEGQTLTPSYGQGSKKSQPMWYSKYPLRDLNIQTKHVWNKPSLSFQKKQGVNKWKKGRNTKWNQKVSNTMINLAKF